MDEHEKLIKAIQAARLYYFQNMTMGAIALQMNFSRSTVSRLIDYAQEKGLINIQIRNPLEESHSYEEILKDNFQIGKAHVVPVNDFLGETAWLESVAQYCANYLNEIFESDMILGIAWGTTMTAISKILLPKTTYNSQIVQLNGAGNTQTMGIEYASEIIMRFAKAYEARAHLFPVPTFFDYAETKRQMWQERSIQRILKLQENADLLLYSIGAVKAGVPSHVYSGEYLEKKDYKTLESMNIVGDIATVFFRKDGTYKNIPLNERASGPDLDLFKEKHGICVVSGLGKVNGLYAALKGGLIHEIIVDEPTARNLINQYFPR
jgi:deoxyribonucleoside regulator